MYFVNQLNQAIRNTEAINKQQQKRRITIHSTKSKIPAAKKGKFVFEPPKAIQSQIDSFFLMCKRNNWDRKLAIKGYKGTFKVEHLIMIETQLRILWPLRELYFIDTQMDREHLIILRQWLSWLEPEKLTLEFQQNEIDDLDFEEFIYFIFERGIDLKRFFIISNPGIYKGQLLKQLAIYLDKKYKTHEIFEYKLIKNKDSKSIAIIRIQKDWNEKEIQNQIEQARDKIDQTCFYNFNLSKCFTKQNYKGFEHLIQLTYDLDNLEQISGLDVSENYLGTMNSFATTCAHISTAKGLLELRIRKQQLIEVSTTVVPLMGDRYDKLRVNVLDIGGNNSILEKTFKIFCNEIFLHCKEINLDGVLTQQLSTLYKLSVMTEAFQERSEYLKKLQRESGKKIMHNFKVFNLATVENYNRHDLVEKFLKNVIFSEYSNLKKLTIQNLDIGRTEAYIKQIKLFKEEITKSQLTNPGLRNFKLPLKEIIIPNQTYRMDVPTIKNFFLEFFFTKKGNVLEIEKCTLIRCFRQSNREEGLKDNCSEIYQKIQDGELKDVEYTVKYIHLEDTTCNMSLNMYKCFLLTNQFKLEGLTVKQDGWDDEFESMYKETITFISKQPSDFIHSLHTLVLYDVSDIKIDVCLFLKLFIYHPQIRLKKLELQKVDLKISENKDEDIAQFSEDKNQNFQFSLKDLTLGTLEKEDLELIFFEHVILTKFSNFEKLTLNKFQFLEQNCEKIKQKQKILQESNKNPFQSLIFLKLEETKFSNPQTWQFFMENIIFHDSTPLKELHLKKLILDNNFKEAIEKATTAKAEQIAVLYQKIEQNEDMSDKSMIALKCLTLEECECKCEIFTNFFPICILTELKFINCKELEQSLKQTMEIHDKEEILQTYNRFTIETFTIQDCQIADLKVFEWLIGDIVFNEEMQKLKHITIQNCKLTDDHLSILTNVIDKIKTESLFKRRYYNLRTINLSGNDGIGEDSWIDFFNKLMEQKRNKSQDEQHKEEILSKQNEKLEQIEQNNDDDEEEKIEKLAQENCELVLANELNVKDKVISSFEFFKPQFPKKLQNLTLYMSFVNFTAAEKDLTYYRIIAGFIINPDSQVSQLKLTEVDLSLFMKNVQKAQNLTAILLTNCYMQDAKQFKIKLAQLELNLMGKKPEDPKVLPEDIQAFVSTFVCSNHVDLVKLTLENFDNIGIVSQILEQMPKKSQYYLEELILSNIKEQLTETESFAFISKILLNQVFPIKKIRLDKDLLFTKASLSELLFEQSQQNLKEVIFIITESQKEIYSNILELIFTVCCLNKIELTYTEKDKSLNEIFESIMDNILIKDLQLEEINFTATLQLDEKWLKFLFKNMKTIKLLSIKELVVDKPEILKDFISTQNIKYEVRQGSQIDIKLIKGDAGIETCLDQLILNHDLGFERVNLRNAKNFSFLKIITNFQNIKEIKLDMGLLYNSSEQLNEDALTLFASKFIYNEESQLENLLLWNNHLKPPGMKALVKPAESFRKQVEEQKRQGSVQLKLKNLNFYYSLYMGVEGHELLMKEMCFYEYIALERMVCEVTNFNNDNCMSLVNSAKKWLAFQKQHKRQYQGYLPLRYLDIGRNEFISEEKVWREFLTTLVFSDNVPLLETCNLHFMAINDGITEYIVKEALTYLNRKPSNFKLPIKKINFFQNNSLTKYGWRNIFKNFFLHPKVDLIELNMISTMLDTQEKLDIIYECFVERANMYPDKKLPMQAFLCFNCTLKDMLFPFLTYMPKDYKEPKDLPTFTDYKSWKFGIHDGIPEEFGAKVLTYNKLLTSYDEFIETNKWKQYQDIKFSPFQLSFTQHYLKVLNDYYKSLNSKQVQIYLNLANLNNFCQIFKYCTERPGEPYPYRLVLQNETYQFLKQRQSQIYKICFIQMEFPNLEIIKQADILAIWKQVKSWRSSIDQIQIEYNLTDDLCEMMFQQGYTERDILQLIRIIPPKSVRLQGGLSLPAVKGLYSILSDVHYFQYSIVSYNFDTFLNTGIGYALRESAYNYQDKNQVTFVLKRIMYKMYNFFVSKTEKYKFDDETIQLNNFLSQKKKYFFLIAFNNILFWLVTIISPYFFTHYYNGDSTAVEQAQYCNTGTSKQASWIYYGFAGLSFLIEVYLFYWFQMQIPSHVEKIEIKIEEDVNEYEDEKKKEQIEFFNKQQKNQVAPITFILPESDINNQLGDAKVLPLNKEISSQDLQKKEEDQSGKTLIQSITRTKTKKEKEQEHFTVKLSKTIKSTLKYFQVQSKKIAESKYIELISHLVGLVLSQLYKFDLYNDVVFILTCYYCQERVLFILALIITAVTQGIYFLQFLYLFYVRLTQTETTAKILSTKFINDIYAIAFLGRNQAITTQLDRVAPYNVSIIPNNWLTRKLLPKIAGRSMSNPVKAYFMQFMLEDLPQTILQAFFAVKRAIMTGGLSSQVYLIIITSIYNFLSSFYLFMSIRPSTLSQDEFDALSNRKRKLYHEIKKNQLEEEKKQLKIFQDLYSSSKLVSPLNPSPEEEQEALL